MSTATSTLDTARDHRDGIVWPLVAIAPQETGQLEQNSHFDLFYTYTLNHQQQAVQ